MLSLSINYNLFSLQTPPIWVFLLMVLLDLRKDNILIGAFFLYAHLIMATFNDFGARHLLPIAPLTIWFISQHKNKNILLSLILLLWGYEHLQFRNHYNASHENFADYIEKKFPQLPRLTLAQAQTENCAWIAEESPFGSQPERSHFNLYHPQEVRTLHKEYGCIYWCAALEDWRWSSLSVRDRAKRIQHIYPSSAVAIVQEKGAQCILYPIAPR